MRLMIGLALLALNVGCATMGGSLLNASDALEERSGQFYDQVRQDSNGGGPSIEAAEALASAAIYFRRAAERDSPHEDLAAAFNRVSGPYQELRQYFDQGSATSSERDRFQGISNAYLDVEGALKFRKNEFSSEMKVR